MDRRGNIKLCDFGISGQLVDSIAKTRDAGCRPYMAVSVQKSHAGSGANRLNAKVAWGHRHPRCFQICHSDPVHWLQLNSLCTVFISTAVKLDRCWIMLSFVLPPMLNLSRRPWRRVSIWDFMSSLDFSKHKHKKNDCLLASVVTLIYYKLNIMY